MSDRVALACIVVGFAALSGLALVGDHWLNDEGLLAQRFAAMVAAEPAAGVFLQKSRPPVALLYAPFAAQGIAPYLVAHVLVAMLGVVLLSAIARTLGHPRPWLPALVLAASPLYFGGAVSGVSNTDVVVGMLLATWLWLARGRLLGAGLVLGTLPWIRAEVALFVLLALAVAWHRRERRLVLGAAAFPLVYALAGALYHADALWMLHYPPALPAPMPDNPFWVARPPAPTAAELTDSALALTPVVPLVALARWRTLAAAERIAVGFAVVFALALVAMPAWQLFNFDRSPRYLLPLLPVLALVIGRAAQWDGERRGLALETVLLVGLAGLAFAVDRAGGGAAALAVVGLAATAVAGARARFHVVATALVGSTAALGPFVLSAQSRLDRFTQAPALEEIVTRLREREDLQRLVVYTNEPLLAPYLARDPELASTRVRYLVQADQLHELTVLSNPSNGQRAALHAQLRRGLYGEPVFPDELRPDDVPAGALFALTDDPRLALVMPRERWPLEVVHTGYAATISRLRREDERAE